MIELDARVDDGNDDTRRSDRRVPGSRGIDVGGARLIESPLGRQIRVVRRQVRVDRVVRLRIGDAGQMANPVDRRRHGQIRLDQLEARDERATNVLEVGRGLWSLPANGCRPVDRRSRNISLTLGRFRIEADEDVTLRGCRRDRRRNRRGRRADRDRGDQRRDRDEHHRAIEQRSRSHSAPWQSDSIRSQCRPTSYGRDGEVGNLMTSGYHSRRLGFRCRDAYTCGELPRRGSVIRDPQTGDASCGRDTCSASGHASHGFGRS